MRIAVLAIVLALAGRAVAEEEHKGKHAPASQPAPKPDSNRLKPLSYPQTDTFKSKGGTKTNGTKSNGPKTNGTKSNGPKTNAQ